jgi:uncharacterized protein YoxC
VALIATSILIPITNLFNKAINASFEKSGMINENLDLDEILKEEKEKLDIETYTTKTNKLIDDLNPLIKDLNDKTKELNDKIKEFEKQKRLRNKTDYQRLTNLLKLKTSQEKKSSQS